MDEHGYTVLGGEAERIADALAAEYSADADLADAVKLGAKVLAGDNEALTAAAARGRAAGPRAPPVPSAASRVTSSRASSPDLGHQDARPGPVACPRTRPLGSSVERRIFGLENEYGVTCTLRGQRRLSPDEVARYLFRRVVSWGRSSNVFLENGARLYLDVGSHPEYATPECDSVYDVVVHDKAGERILESLVQSAEVRLREEGIRGEVYLFKNNTDSAGNSYGCHENYCVERDGDFAKFTDVLIPFLVSRQVYAGAGRCSRPRVARCTASRNVPSTSGKASPPRPPGPVRSSTPATSRTPTPSATAGST